MFPLESRADGSAPSRSLPLFVAGVAATERGYNLKGLNAGFALSYLLNETRSDTWSANSRTGLGLLDADNWFQRAQNSYVNGYENSIGGTLSAPQEQDY
jgi:hypothetical protein